MTARHRCAHSASPWSVGVRLRPMHALGRLFTGVVLLFAAAGCASVLPTVRPRSGIRVPQTPALYYTALEAYARIKPEMLSWHEDAFVGGVRAVLGGEAPQWGVQTDNRVPWWVFVVSSPQASTFTEIHLVGDQVVVGFEGIPGYEKPSSRNAVPLAIDDLIDSDRALAIP